MKYYATFVNGKASCYWSKEDGASHPSYIKQNELAEITKEQFDNIECLILEDGIIKFDEEKYIKKNAKLQKIEKKKSIAKKIKALTNTQISSLPQNKKDKLLVYLIDAVFDRDEIEEDVLGG
ncbi:MAG: hypothetical protein JSU91_01820 [Thermoplasmatales archaeon]|nr:MAG: hypothetical protein JSU91_01820 [Thermoplasmatales archaeon]